jgi:hypothetical protein
MAEEADWGKPDKTGTLIRIPKITTHYHSEAYRGKLNHESERQELVVSVLETELEIKNGKKVENLSFPGQVNDASIGNRVAFYVRAGTHPEDLSTPEGFQPKNCRTVHNIYRLHDLDLDRDYIAIMKRGLFKEE